jgi:hypothetical protein
MQINVNRKLRAQKDLWILDGWPEAETIAAFKLLGRTEEEAIEAYTISIRGMVRIDYLVVLVFP